MTELINQYIDQGIVVTSLYALLVGISISYISPLIYDILTSLRQGLGIASAAVFRLNRKSTPPPVSPDTYTTPEVNGGELYAIEHPVGGNGETTIVAHRSPKRIK